ncbi:thiopeptide-type bacteriocin biosynthesis protein [Aquimarina sp. 2201CG14-23]|uniref:thiopeptide-type bacteriocin biosynthesis protein n=1 Tax=Aquimarina mycalae TaxID=3040073 RepID=UPI002477FE95|nr:thiopeptide-type bacteriocin biosynthesis protein [Aquimarina sp. 2201CG14-23]MDH7446916.1 thiopeptide-type bacteriocin biosynthesis protein [Aquimarina sp. 2201CG14-23]
MEIVKSNTVNRNFIIGSEWLYYKIYTGAKTSDMILTDVLKPLTEKLIKEKQIDKWFFIRYADPKHHIRVRFNYKHPEKIGVIINAMHTALHTYVTEDLVWKIQIDTYQREIERYGLKTIGISEELFYYESKMIVDFIAMIDDTEGEELRWLFALKAMDNLLNIFDYKLSEKLHLLDTLRISFAQEFSIQKSTKKQINAKYNTHRTKISEFLDNSISNPEFQPIEEILKTNYSESKEIGKYINQLNEENGLDIPLNQLIASYIHMLMNRIFKSKNRLHEMVCYDFLTQYYKMQTFSNSKKQKVTVKKTDKNTISA